MTAVKCPKCGRFANYEWYDDRGEGDGSLEFIESEYQGDEAWQKYAATCPLCGTEFSYFEVYKFSHFETEYMGGGDTYTQKNVNDAERRMAAKSQNRRHRR